MWLTLQGSWRLRRGFEDRPEQRLWWDPVHVLIDPTTQAVLCPAVHAGVNVHAIHPDRGGAEKAPLPAALAPASPAAPPAGPARAPTAARQAAAWPWGAPAGW